MLEKVLLWFNDMEAVLTVLSNMGMLGVAIISAWYAYRAYKHQKDRSKKDAACELAAYYADVITEECRYIYDVFRKTELDQFVRDTIDLNQISKFDVAELASFTQKKKLPADIFKRRLNEIDPLIIIQCKILRANSVTERRELQDYYERLSNLQDTDDERKREASVLLRDFTDAMARLMNHLEWFCMKCSYQLAEEELIYRSLHQTFLSTVWLLYPFISCLNTEIAEKYFTNTIWLFNKWQQRVADVKQMAEEQRRMCDAELEKLCNSTPLR